MVEQRFTLIDQQIFAELSGDFNPIHIDPIAARRLLFGRPVVHGIHLLLWALDNWVARRAESLELCSLKADFQRPVPIDTTVTYRLIKEEKEGVWIELETEGRKAVSIEVVFAPRDRAKSVTVSAGRPNSRAPRVLCMGKTTKVSGDLALCLDVNLATRLFPNAQRILPPMQVAELLATTRLVGMECPGLHSIYSGLDITFDREIDWAPVVSYEVTDYDDRFSLLLMRVFAPGMKGAIRAFLRPPPQEQVSFLDVQQVNATEFAGQHALIIGGSRGIGEVTAKLLAAGGADLKTTYYQGADDAHRIVEEIISGGGVADCFAFDVLNPRQDLADCMGQWVPTHLYYFATPFIFAATKGTFSPQLFQKFCDYYVTGFLTTVKAIQSVAGSAIQRIFYPSSVAIDELPLNMGEYAAAKMAGETLCAFVEKTNRGIKIVRPRLPRLATDQTRSLLPVKNEDPVPIILEALRRFRDA